MGLMNSLGLGGGGSSLGLGKGVSGGASTPRRIRKVDVAKGTRGLAFRKAIRKNVGKALNVKKIEKKDGKTVAENVQLNKKEVEEFIRDRYLEEVGRKSTVSSLKRRLKKNQGFVAKGGIKYKIGGSKRNIEKRDEIGNLLVPEGPTRKDLELQAKKDVKKQRRNIFSSVQSGEEAQRRIDNREDPKANLKKNVETSSRLNIAGQKYKTSSGGEEESTDDFRGGGKVAGVLNEGHAGEDKSSNTSFAQGSEGAASVTEGIGTKSK